MSEVLNLDELCPFEESKVKYREKWYVLRPPSEDTVLKWKKMQAGDMKLQRTKDGKGLEPDDVRLSPMNLLESKHVLVGESLFYADGKDKDRVVGPLVLRGWDARALDHLYTESVRIGRLNQTDSVESLDNAIGVLQERKESLRNGVVDSLPKDSPSATIANSG